MNVDGAETRDREQPGRKDLAVVSDDDAIRREARDGFPCAPAADSFRLLDRYSELQRQPLDPAEARAVMPTRGPIRLGKRRHHYMVRVKSAQYRFRKGGGAQEDDAEALHFCSSDPPHRAAAGYQSPRRMRRRSLRTMRSRFRSPSRSRKRRPFRWSTSWAKARASNPSPSIS